jgi:hypothetical protein
MHSRLHNLFAVFKAKVKFSISTETDIYVLDDTGTEVDEEVFTDILEEKTDILWTIVDVLSVSGKWSFDCIVHRRVTVATCGRCNRLCLTKRSCA